jgi:hypothetical protein
MRVLRAFVSLPAGLIPICHPMIPDRLLNDHGRKAVTGVADLRHHQCLPVRPRGRKPATPVTISRFGTATALSFNSTKEAFHANDQRAVRFQRTARRKDFSWLVDNTSGRSNQKCIAT